MDFPGGASGKEPTCKAGEIRDAGSIPGLGRSPGGRHVNSLQYPCLENPMDRRAWQAIVHRVTQIWTQLKQLSTHTHVLYCLKSPCFGIHTSSYLLNHLPLILEDSLYTFPCVPQLGNPSKASYLYFSMTLISHNVEIFIYMSISNGQT